MKTYSFTAFKAHLSIILDIVQEGEEIGIAYERKQEVVAVLITKKTQVNEWLAR